MENGQQRKWTAEHEDGHWITVSAGDERQLRILGLGGYQMVNLQDGQGWKSIVQLMAEINLGRLVLDAH